jgi:hypothetical protein
VIARMFAIRSSRRALGAVLLAIGGLLIGSACTDSETSARTKQLASLRQERHDLVQRFSNIQSGIRRTQAAALDDPGVRMAQDTFYAELRRVMQREGPEAVELLDRAVRVGNDVERLSGPVPMMTGEPVTLEQQQAVVGELQETERELRPYLQRALADPAVQSAFAALQNSLVAEMARLDPNSPGTIRRMKETAEEIRQVEIRIAELESGP